MAGELWQACELRGCNNEPVCAECYYCTRHCTCDAKPETPPTTQHEKVEAATRVLLTEHKLAIETYPMSPKFKRFVDAATRRPVSKRRVIKALADLRARGLSLVPR